jgi:DNA-binding protein H-NS
MVGNLFSFLIQQLLSIIKTLQAKVTEEAMKKAMMELRIREEVAQEMNEQIAEIENMYRFVYDIITIAGKSILK